MANIDWGRLYNEGRCKNFGVPWSEAEARAVSLLKIPADYVRRGCLTVAKYEAMQKEDVEEVAKTGKKPLSQCNKAQLEKLCAEYGIEYTAEATRLVLIEELKLKGCPNQVEVGGGGEN